jgi:Protein of unknown function (DUF4232)
MRDDELRERFKELADSVASEAEQPAAARIRSRGRRARRHATGTALLMVTLLAVGGMLLMRGLILPLPQPTLSDGSSLPDPTSVVPAPSSPSSTTQRVTRPESATTTTVTPKTTGTSRSSTPAPCRARQLSGENRGSDGAAGSLGLTVALRNTGSTSCTLTGEPTVVLLRNGTALPTHAERDSSEPPATLTVRPNRTVTFIIIWTNPDMEADPSTCQPESTHIRLTPPNQDGTLTIPAVITTCHGNLRLTPPAP